MHGGIIRSLELQVAVLGNCSLRCSTSCIHAVVDIPHQKTLAFQPGSDPLTDRLDESFQRLGARRREAAKHGSLAGDPVHSVQKQHMGRSNASCVRGISASMHVK